MTERLDCTPVVLDLKLYAGDDTRLRLTFLGDNKEPLDLSGMLACEVRRAATSSTPVVVRPALEVGNVAVGEVTLTFTTEDTVALLGDGGRHVWDLEHMKDGFVTTLVRGQVVTCADVTTASYPVPVP